MDLLRQVQDILGNTDQSAASGSRTQTLAQAGSTTGGASDSPLGGLSNLLGPALLGGLAGALFSGKARGMAGGALLAGAGAALWKKYTTSMGDQPAPRQDKVRDAELQSASWNQPEPMSGAPAADPLAASMSQWNASQSSSQDRAARLVRALVFAAKSDGHIDEKEQAAISEQVRRLNMGPEAQTIVEQALSEPLDPARIADGVQNAQEALEVFALSCAVLDVDHFMERSYLDALAKALNIPDEVKNDLEAHVRQGQ
jgi:uncharacterized membrane protein YebE (DUF533 family)